jgi:DNA-binding transcriptional LysR family regulator
VKDLVARYEALATDQTGEALGGTVVMGALVSALMGAFADSLWSLTRQHPDLDVTLFAGQSADFAVRVDRGELDAAVVTQPPMRLPANLVWTPLYTEPMVLIVPARPLRSNSTLRSSTSSARICWPTAAAVRPISLPAAEKLPRRATARKLFRVRIDDMGWTLKFFHRSKEE